MSDSDDDKPSKVTNLKHWARDRWRKPRSHQKPGKRGSMSMQHPGYKRVGSGSESSAAEDLQPTTETIARLKTRPGIRAVMLALPFWITPNGVTFFRTLLIGPVLMLELVGAPWAWWTALALFAFSMSLDFVDGALAHARNMNTPLGAFYDQAADKIAIWSVVAAVPSLWTSDLGTLTFLAGISFAIALVLLRLWKMFRTADDSLGARLHAVAANGSGKTKLVTETVAASLCLLGTACASPWLVTGGIWLLCPAVLLGVLSLVRHATGWE